MMVHSRCFEPQPFEDSFSLVAREFFRVLSLYRITMDDLALDHVERQRAELEVNNAKLRKALRHWQTLEIDYEGLREEFLGMHDDSSPQELLQAAKDFNPELVDEKEI